MNRADQRGLFLGLVNQGVWQEVNFVKTQAGQIRGGHFHTRTNEVIFLVRGRAEVELQACDRSQQKQVFILNAGEGVQIKPYILHTLRYLEDSEQIALLDVPFDPADPDLHTLTPGN
ncbi:polysaccharide biosynthesis C-terminal domain-containing protein [Tolypothrix sp. NIES-4075]|uniref:polysaccharide biosynthesis C-terminal domain-containing protein n=1 Tax=Tolypothrix sp. NIES-4075 TaxID=2005459 RepID=UPI000B5CFF1F|nr:WxcM-like domain-containing protein [Tolypothrix sp. NIES-4075]